MAPLSLGGKAALVTGSGQGLGRACYLQAKQAVYGMTKCAALDYGANRIRVNAVAPVAMWTSALRRTAAENPGYIETITGRVPPGRVGEPEEVAAAVVGCSPQRLRMSMA